MKTKTIEPTDGLTAPHRRVRRPAILLGVGLTAALLAGCSTERDTEAHQKPTAEASQSVGPTVPATPESRTPMPSDLQEMLRSVTSADLPADKLIDMPFKELSTFTLGNRNVRIVQAGGEFSTGPLSTEQLDKFKHNLELFDTFAHSGASFTAPVTEGDSDYQVVSERSIKFRVDPQDKPITIFAVPSSVDLGTFGAEGGPKAPNVLTSTKGAVNISFVRPDYPDTTGTLVEACQATTNVKIDDPAGLADIAPETIKKITALGQESLCNALGEVITASRHTSFDQYLVRVGKDGIGGTEAPTPEHNAFYMSMPYVDNSQAYPTLDSAIPANIGDSFRFSSVTTG